MKRLVRILKKYLIPHEENDHRPHLLRPRAVMFVALIALVIQSLYLFGSSYLIPRSKLFGIIVTTALVDGTNQARTTSGLAALKENALLDLAAQEKANDMATQGYFAHTSPTGVTPWFWFQKVGYDYVAAGENLAVDFSDSQDVTNAWLNSPTHRANIMNAGYTEIGMASAQGTFQGHPAIFVVEEFGTPAPVFAFAPVAKASAPTAAPTAPVTVPVTPKPAPKPAPKPVAVAIAKSSTVVTNSAGNAVAIQGAETSTQSSTPQVMVQTPAPAAAPTPAPAKLNWVQFATVDPRRTADLIYFGIALLFAAALLINIFVKVRIQHAQVILGGMLVILIAGLLIIINAHSGGGVVII